MDFKKKKNCVIIVTALYTEYFAQTRLHDYLQENGLFENFINYGDDDVLNLKIIGD